MATVDRSNDSTNSSAVQPITGVVLWMARGAALVLLGLGVYIWTGNGDQLIPFMMGVGFLFVLCLWTIAGIAVRSRVSAVLVAGAVVWSLFTTILGIAQDSLVPGGWHWTIQVLHLVVALAILVWCEVLVSRIRSKAALGIAN